MSQELVLIYVGGFQSDLRPALFTLVERGLAIDVDEINQASLVVEKGKHKVRSTTCSFTVVTERANMETVMQRLAAVPETRAYAVPVLASIDSHPA